MVFLFLGPWGINLGQILNVFVCLRILRDFAGLRLIRLGDTVAVARDGTITLGS